MKDDFSQIMTPFDLSVSSPSLQMIKFIIPFLPPRTQRMMAIYIKFIELQNTFSSFSSIQTANGNPFDELKKVLPASALETYDNLMNMMSMMQFMSEMDGDFDPMSMMADMFETNQKEGVSE